VRLVTFAPMLKHGLFPLADLCRDVLATASEALNKPVEIEFAVNLRANLGEPREMGFLQLRPFVASLDGEEAEIGEVARDELVCRSNNVLGHGEPEGLKDLLVVEAHRFERAKSRQAAREVAQFNAALVASGTPYVLVGVGRWGSLDPWLGIPVTWDQIAGARVIVEAGFRDFKVTPSQGSHFFQNVTSFQIGYFTVDENEQGAWLDWDWLAAQPSADETEFVRHLRLDRPLRVRMNGRKREGIILKPG